MTRLDFYKHGKKYIGWKYVFERVYLWKIPTPWVTIRDRDVKSEAYVPDDLVNMRQSIKVLDKYIKTDKRSNQLEIKTAKFALLCFRKHMRKI